MNIRMRQFSWILLFGLHTSSPMDSAAAPDRERVRELVREQEIIGTVIDSFRTLHELLANTRENAADFENQISSLNEALTHVRVATTTLPSIISSYAPSLAIAEQYAQLEALLEHTTSHLNQAQLIFRVAPRILSGHHDESVAVTMVNSAFLEIQYAQEFVIHFLTSLAKLDERIAKTKDIMRPAQEAADGILHITQSPEMLASVARAIPAVTQRGLDTLKSFRKRQLTRQDPTLLLNEDPVAQPADNDEAAAADEEDTPLVLASVLEGADKAHAFCAKHVPTITGYLRRYGRNDLTKRQVAAGIDFALRPPLGSKTFGALSWLSFIAPVGWYVPEETEVEKKARITLLKRLEDGEISRDTYDAEKAEAKKARSERYDLEKASMRDGLKRYAAPITGLGEAVCQDLGITEEQRAEAQASIKKHLPKVDRFFRNPEHVEQITSFLHTAVEWSGSALRNLHILADHQKESEREEAAIIEHLKTLGLRAQEQLAERRLVRQDPS